MRNEVDARGASVLSASKAVLGIFKSIVVICLGKPPVFSLLNMAYGKTGGAINFLCSSLSDSGCWTQIFGPFTITPRDEKHEKYEHF